MRFEQAIIVNPPDPPGYVSNKDSMGGFGQLFPVGAAPAPALDLPYLAAYLREADVPVHVIEAGALGLDNAALCRAIEVLPRSGPRLVLLRTSLPTIDWDLHVAAAIRRECTACAIALIGPVVASLRARIERDAALDYAITGEPDATALELLRGDALPEIQGLLFRDDAGAFVANPERPFTRDLDALPMPAWELFPIERYALARSANAGRLRYLPMLTSRGCPYGCSYCPYPVGQGLRWRFRSPENVVDEMERLVADFGVEYVLFRDPMFSLRQDRVVAICDEIRRRRLSLRWRCETRMDCLDEATIAAMAAAGCRGVNFGVESSDPEIQKGVDRRPISQDEFRRKVALCRQHGIETFAFFVVGLPGDTVETILDSIAFAVEIGASWTQFTVSTPFIGTKLHAWARERGLVPEGFYQIISSHEGSIGNENLSPEQVHRLHRFAQLVQRNLINRRGVLKNATRENGAYRAARRAADGICNASARALVRAARWHFTRALRPAAAGASPS